VEESSPRWSSRNYCATEGVHHQHTTPYSPKQNGVIERQNGTVVATAKSMLKAKWLPGWFWDEAVNTIVYVLNLCPTKSVDGMTPFEVWHGRKPAVHHLRTFRCIVYVRNVTPHLKKPEDHCHKMILSAMRAAPRCTVHTTPSRSVFM
jgi:hypothetical protein